MTSTNKIQKHQLLQGDRDPLAEAGMIDLRAAKSAAIKNANK